MIELTPSSYYYRPKISRSEREASDADIKNKIEQIQKVHPKSGYRTVQQYLARNGVRIGERKIRQIMRKYALFAKLKRAFRKTTDSNHNNRVYPNLLPGRTVMSVNEVWTADLTYIRIANGFVYLAVIMDLYSRRVVGWQISKQIDTKLALDALEMAIQRRKPKPGCVHHSDRGVQYLCKEYVAVLKKHSFLISNSSKANPYDNAWTERFMRTLKQEEVYLANYETYLDVIENLPEFIESVYNEKRVHSGIEYLTPVELEKMVETDPSKTKGRFDLKL